MSLKSSNPARRPAGNPKLAAAIARCQGSPSAEMRSDLQKRLMAAPLLVAIQDLPEGFGPGGETAVRFLVQKRGEGIIVCGFSSHEALTALAPSAVGPPQKWDIPVPKTKPNRSKSLNYVFPRYSFFVLAQRRIGFAPI